MSGTRHDTAPVCYVLAGPTASGKTALSLDIAEKLNCEILCMDSMQIYRRMDIGTAKPTKEEQGRVPHHLLDLAEPESAFSVADYAAAAEPVVRDVLSRGKTPLFVGGTGLYLRNLRHPMALGDTPADPAFRAEMEALAAGEHGKETLHRMLEEKDPVTAARLHLNDVRRVIRALEVEHATGVPFSCQRQEEAPPPFRFRAAALSMDRALLYERIERRVDLMLEEGLVNEVRSLLDSGVPRDAQSMKGLGYKELLPYLDGQCSLAEAVDALKQGTRHYAKRQMTWFRREEDLLWVDPFAPDALSHLLQYYSEVGNENA